MEETLLLRAKITRSWFFFFFLFPVILLSRSPIDTSSRLDTEKLPAKACKGGIRSNIHFPT